MSKPPTSVKIHQSQNCKIYETPCFKDGEYFLKKDKATNTKKLVIFDVDNTILSYRHTLGTDEWFDFDFNEFVQKGLSIQQAKSQTVSTYLEIIKKIHNDDIYVIEEDTPEVIRKFQDDNIATLVLTSRGDNLLQQTIDQLLRFELDFNKGKFVGRQKNLENMGSIFTHGMIFTSGQNKGKCLISCLQDFDEKPLFIMMWDDKKDNLIKVCDAIEAYNANATIPIRFVGIRYSKQDHLVKNFNPEIAKIQEKYNQRILSDELALFILKSENKKERKYCVDIDFQLKNNIVILSLHKPQQYQILQNIDHTIDQHRILGSLKYFYGKPKLAWQFKFSVDEFDPVFHGLSQHGLIEPAQFDMLSQFYNSSKKPIISQYQNYLKKEDLIKAPVYESTQVQKGWHVLSP